MEQEKKEFKSSYILRILSGDYHPFTPNVVSIDQDNLEYRRRNWHMISVDTENLHFQNVVGVTVDKHLFGSTLIIKSSGNDPIKVNGLSKKKANKVREICSKYISENTQKGTTEAMADAISKAVGDTKGGQTSVADELKKLKELVDEGVISQEEFEAQKKKFMSS